MSLLANAVCQLLIGYLTHRYREQAHSYSFDRVSYFDLVVQLTGRAQRPGIAEQEQIAHQLLEH